MVNIRFNTLVTRLMGRGGRPEGWFRLDGDIDEHINHLSPSSVPGKGKPQQTLTPKEHHTAAALHVSVQQLINMFFSNLLLSALALASAAVASPIEIAERQTTPQKLRISTFTFTTPSYTQARFLQTSGPLNFLSNIQFLPTSSPAQTRQYLPTFLPSRSTPHSVSQHLCSHLQPFSPN